MIASEKLLSWLLKGR